MPLNADIIIVGGGIIGCSAALLLAKTTNWQITLLDAKNLTAIADTTLPTTQYDPRISALNQRSQHILEGLMIWAQLKTTPYRHMEVWDKQGQGSIRFAATSFNRTALGHIVNNQQLYQCLLQAVLSHKQIECHDNLQLEALITEAPGIRLHSQQQCWRTPLLLAADGIHSWVRNQTGIALSQQQDYQQDCIVCQVDTEKLHQFTAWQCFGQYGPLALLPLDNEQRCALLWSQQRSKAQSLLNLSEHDFCQQATLAMEHKLGKISHASPRHSFPLQLQLSQDYSRPHLALLGDAAHCVHPLAGLGLNMGLADVDFLGQLLQTAQQRQRCYYSQMILRRYARQRKTDSQILAQGIDLIHYVFNKHNSWLNIMRNIGLKWVDQQTLLKKWLAQQAFDG